MIRNIWKALVVPSPRPEQPLDLGISTSRGNSLITDICALYLHTDDDTWMATSGWMACLGALDIVEGAGRTALHRMSRGGYLQREPRRGVAGYAMSPAWRRLMDTTPDPEPVRWLVVAFTVPEDRRAERHQLRTVLTKSGFGSLGNGVWLGATTRADQLTRVLSGGGLDDYVDKFAADYLGSASDEELARRCWDLAALAAEGHELLSRLDQLRRQRVTDGPEAFARWVDANHAVRLYVSGCPELPEGAQPRDWPVPRVASAVQRLADKVAPAAGSWLEGVRYGRASVPARAGR